MAVTQQLARVAATQLAACRRSVADLDALCSFKSFPQDDYLDMNWWPVVLERAWELTGADARTMAVLRSGFAGDREVNPSYRDHPDTIWEHPVTALEPRQVSVVATALRTVSPDAVHAVVPTNPDQFEAALGGTAAAMGENLADRLARQQSVLRDFYAGAAQRRLAVVLWWD